MFSWVLRLGIRSAVSLFFANSGSLRGAWLAVALVLPGRAPAQLTTGTVEGTVRTADGRALADVAITVSGGAGLSNVVRSNLRGQFVVTLPYGGYQLSTEVKPGVSVVVAPLQTTRVDLVVDAAGALHSVRALSATPGIWSDNISAGCRVASDVPPHQRSTDNVPTRAADRR
jgi:hypothetical protein